MSLLMDELYYAMIGGPHPDQWPEYLENNPVQAHGMNCFREGIRLGLLLAVEAFSPEVGE